MNLSLEKIPPLRGIQIGLGVFSLVIGVGATLSYLHTPYVPPPVIITSPVLHTLPPHKHNQGDAVLGVRHGVVTYATTTAPRDMWVNEIDVKLKNFPTSIVHHIRMYSVKGIDPECPGTLTYDCYLGIGRETYTEENRLPKPYALFIKKGTVIILETALHNPEPPEGTGATYKDVSVEVTMRSPDLHAGRPIQVYNEPLVLQDAPFCTPDAVSGSAFSVPAYTMNYVKKTEDGPDRSRFVAPKDGIIVASGAHSHGWDGGKEVTLYKNGSPLFTWLAYKSGNGVTTGRWSMQGNLPRQVVKEGDEFTLSATYDNPEAELVPDAMAITNLYYVPNP